MTALSTTPGATTETTGRGGIATRVPAIWLAALALVVVAVAATSLAGDSLLQASALRGVAAGMTVLGLVALGQTLAMVVGSFDLSVAWTVSLGALVTGVVMDGRGAWLVPAVLLALTAGGAVGLLNGVIITKLDVNPLIATLAVSLLLSGGLNVAVETQAGAVSDGFRQLGFGTFVGVPVGFILTLLLAVVLGWWLQRSVTGHHVYAVGGSAEVARLAGVRADRVTILAHVLCGVFAAAAGVYLASRLGATDAGVGPRGGYDLESIAVVVLGGTTLGGGKGTVAGTAAGVLIFAVLDATLDLLGIDPFLKTVIEGTVIVAAVASNTLRARQRGAR